MLTAEDTYEILWNDVFWNQEPQRSESHRPALSHGLVEEILSRLHVDGLIRGHQDSETMLWWLTEDPKEELATMVNHVHYNMMQVYADRKRKPQPLVTLDWSSGLEIDRWSHILTISCQNGNGRENMGNADAFAIVHSGEHRKKM